MNNPDVPDFIKDMNPEVRAYLADEAQQYLAQKSLMDYFLRVNPGYQPAKHISYWASLLEACERGESRNLAISAAPGHSKSSLMQAFTGYFIGRDPRRRVLFLSANEGLSSRNSIAVRGQVLGEKWPFPNVKLVGQAIEEWRTPQGGGVRSIGRTGTVTGFRAELILADDTQPDAGTEKSRADDYDWFRGVVTTRLEPGGICVIIANRFHDMDIIGQLQADEAHHKWKFINIPALALEGDELGRKEGEALWPERWPVELLLEKKEDLGPVLFNSLYQCDPAPAGGAMFTPGWLNNRYKGEPPMGKYPELAENQRLLNQYSGVVSPPRKHFMVIQSCDSAWKTGIQNDRSVITTMSTDGRFIYIIDCHFGRWAFPDLRRVMVEQYDKWKPSRLYVEEAASGYALIEDLKRSTGIPIIGVTPGTEQKVARAQSTTGWWEAGRVLLPESAPWIAEFINEFVRFPYGRHDDIVDSVTLGIRQIKRVQAQWLSEANQYIEQDLDGWFDR